MAVSLGNLVSALAYAGVGAGVGSVGAAWLNTHAGRSEARAHAADMIAEAAGDLADRQSTVIERLEEHDEKLRKAVLMLTQTLDEMLPVLDLPAPEVVHLRKALTAVKLAL